MEFQQKTSNDLCPYFDCQVKKEREPKPEMVSKIDEMQFQELILTLKKINSQTGILKYYFQDYQKQLDTIEKKFDKLYANFENDKKYPDINDIVTKAKSRVLNTLYHKILLIAISLPIIFFVIKIFFIIGLKFFK